MPHPLANTYQTLKGVDKRVLIHDSYFNLFNQTWKDAAAEDPLAKPYGIRHMSQEFSPESEVLYAYFANDAAYEFPLLLHVSELEDPS